MAATISLPVAIRAPNGLWFSHSLPKDSDVEKFDFSVFERELEGDDFKRKTGAAYQLIWGRGVTEAGALLQIRSAPGLGTTVRLEVPLQPGARAATGTAATIR